MESVIDIIIESSFIDVHDICGDWGGVFSVKYFLYGPLVHGLQPPCAKKEGRRLLLTGCSTGSERPDSTTRRKCNEVAGRDAQHKKRVVATISRWLHDNEHNIGYAPKKKAPHSKNLA